MSKFPLVQAKKKDIGITLDQFEELNKNVGRLIGLVSEISSKVDGNFGELKKIGLKVDDHSVKFVGIQSILSLNGERSITNSVKEISVKSNLTPVSALTEECPQDTAWRAFQLTEELESRLSDPEKMEEIAIATGCDFLLNIRFATFSHYYQLV
jgi:hypothetical protein